MTGNVNDTDKFWEVQGDRVFVRRHGYADRVFKIVRVVDVGSQQLRLVHETGHSPDWPLSQALWDALQPATPAVQATGVKWVLALK